MRSWQLAVLGAALIAGLVAFLAFRHGGGPRAATHGPVAGASEPDERGESGERAGAVVEPGSPPSNSPTAKPGQPSAQRRVDREKLRRIMALAAAARAARAEGGGNAGGGGNAENGHDEGEDDADEKKSATERAKQHFENGQEAFLAKRFDEAAEEFLEAYNDKPAPTFLFNAAVSFEKIGQCADAIELFQRYLDEAGAGVHDRDRVLERIDRLTNACGAEFPPQVADQEN